MKRILFLLLFASYFVHGQAPVQVSQPQYFLKYVWVHDSLRASIYFQNPNDTLATQAYARQFGGIGPTYTQGVGIKIVGNVVNIDTGNYRKMDSLYVITDSTGIFKINGTPYAFKMRGAVFGINGRSGNVTIQSSDVVGALGYVPISPSGTYANPSWITSLAWSKITGSPTTLLGYGISNAVINSNGGYSLGSGLIAARPAYGNPGSFYYATDSGTLYYDNGTAWVTISSGGGTTDSGVVNGTWLIKTTSGSTIYLKADSAAMAGYFPRLNDSTVKYVTPTQAAANYAPLTSLGTKLNISDTANKWVAAIKRSSDSVYYFKNNTWVFAFLDSIGGAVGGSDSGVVNSLWITKTVSGTTIYLGSDSGAMASYFPRIKDSTVKYMTPTQAANIYATIANLSLKVNISDTSGKWIGNVFISNDSIYFYKGASRTLAGVVTAGSGSTNLGNSQTSTTVTITSSSGTSTTIPAVTNTTAGVMTAQQKLNYDSVYNGQKNDTSKFIIQGAGSGGDTLTYARNDSLFTHLFRDSLLFGHQKNADGSFTFYTKQIDTTNILNFSAKVRSLFSAGTYTTYNQAAGAFGVDTSQIHSTAWNNVNYAAYGSGGGGGLSPILNTGYLYGGNANDSAKATCNWPNETTLGYLKNDSVFFSSYEFQKFGGATAVANSSGTLTFMTVGSGYTHYMTFGTPHNFHDWTFSTTFQVANATGAQDGHGIGIQAINSVANYGIQTLINLATGSGAVYIIINGTIVATAGTSLSWSQNDNITDSLILTDSVLTYKVNNVTTGAAQVSCSYTFANGYPQTNLRPNEGTFGIWGYGGTHIYSRISVYSPDIKNPNWLALGDSKLIYYAGSFAKDWPNLLKQQTTLGSGNIFAGAGDQAYYGIQELDNAFRVNPRYIIWNLETNDIHNSRTIASILYDDSIFVNRSLQAGITPLLMVIPEDSTGTAGLGTRALYNALLAKWPQYFMSGLYSDMCGGTFGILNSAYNSGDGGVHPNAAGHAEIASSIVTRGYLSSCTLRTGRNGNSDQSLIQATNITYKDPSQVAIDDSTQKAAYSAGTPPLTATQVGYGSSGGVLTGSSNFVYTGTSLNVGGSVSGWTGNQLNVVSTTTSGGIVTAGTYDGSQYAYNILSDQNGYSSTGHGWVYGMYASYNYWMLNYNGLTITRPFGIHATGATNIGTDTAADARLSVSDNTALRNQFKLEYDGTRKVYFNVSADSSLSISGFRALHLTPSQIPISVSSTDSALYVHDSSNIDILVKKAVFPQMVASGDSTGKNSSPITLSSYTSANAGTFRVGGYVTITTAGSDVLNFVISWTDETSTSRTVDLAPQGTISPNISGAGVFLLPSHNIRVKASTTITVQVVNTNGTATYDAGATIEQLK